MEEKIFEDEVILFDTKSHENAGQSTNSEAKLKQKGETTNDSARPITRINGISEDDCVRIRRPRGRIL